MTIAARAIRVSVHRLAQDGGGDIRLKDEGDTLKVARKFPDRVDDDGVVLAPASWRVCTIQRGGVWIDDTTGTHGHGFLSLCRHLGVDPDRAFRAAQGAP